MSLADLEEHVGLVADDWPMWLHELATKDMFDETGSRRFLITFLGNDAPPFVTIKHMLPKLKDLDALLNTKDVLMRLSTGTMPKHYSIKYWDIALDMMLPLTWAMHRPNFKDHTSWTETFKLLDTHVAQMRIDMGGP
jgi:hypothetical protein